MKILFTLVLLLSLPACGDSADSKYFPLKQQQLLTYHKQLTRSDGSFENKFLIRITGPESIAGKQLYLQQTASGISALLERNDDGIYQVGSTQHGEHSLNATPVMIMPIPLTVGSRWQTLTQTELLEWRKYSLEKIDRGLRIKLPMDYHCTKLDARIITPAGNFQNVAVIKGYAERRMEFTGDTGFIVIKIDSTQWYAPGIGLIKSERTESVDRREINPGESVTVLERID
ncbi:MAG: hypothetical protein WD572_06435 [Gammaproteobacteria bacterium]